MALISRLFRDNQRLQACAVSDPAHVTRSCRGDFVQLIQMALIVVDSADIADDEMQAQLYGDSTAAAVLSYKTKWQIINYSYQNTPDDIVGKMTIARLDADLAALDARNMSPVDPSAWSLSTFRGTEG
jgi:hypothetical protein